jgi:hypothetical protein
MNIAAAQSQRSPAWPLRVAGWGALGLALAGAVYLYAVRGTALLLDLASGVAGILCL